MRILLRYAWPLAAVLAIVNVPGCSGGFLIPGGSALTGGSVPVGTARLAGIVVRSDNTSQAVGDTQVTLVLLPPTRAARTRAAGDPETGGDDARVPPPPPPPGGGTLPTTGLRTGEDGRFDFGGIPGGEYLFVAEPPPSAELRTGFQWRFTLPDSTKAYMVAAMWPRWFDPSTVASVTIAPGEIILHPGDSVRFVTTATDQNGAAIPLSPSLLLLGDIGTIDADGTLHADRVGHATITAWMNGPSATATITVIP